MRHFVSRVVATSEPRGNLEAVERLVKQVDETGAEAVVVLGSLAPQGTTRAYGHLFKALAQTHLPTFYLPGPEDVPIAEYVRDAATMELVYPYLHGVHGTFAFAPGYVVLTGMGGMVSNDPHTMRDEQKRLCYPGWGVEYVSSS